MIGMERIFGFNHKHLPGEICAKGRCPHQIGTLVGNSVHFEDIPMLIVRESSAQEYLAQPLQEGESLPPIQENCPYFYAVQMD